MRYRIKLLPVVDNFERALAAIDTADEKSFREGVIMVAKQLDSVLANIGVEKIQALGCKFDPNVHNALCTHRMTMWKKTPLWKAAERI